MFQTDMLQGPNLNASNYFDFQGLSGPDSSGQHQLSQFPLPFMRSFSDPSPHIYQEYSVFPHPQRQTQDGAGLDFLAFGSPSPDAGSAVPTAGVVDGVHSYQDDQANMRLDFNEDIPMWNDHMLNELLSAPPT